LFHPSLEPIAQATREAVDNEEYSVDGGMNNELLQDGMLGSIVGGIGGAALTKSPGGAMTGAKLGSAAQDAFGEEETDGSCNYTAEGEHCPEHGLMECGSMYEGEQDTISRLQELSGMNNSKPDMAEGMEDSPVASAITRRILMQRSDLLSKYGPEKVTAAIDEVADFVGDVEEIGSSDVSGWIKQIEQMLGNMAEEVAVTTGNPPPGETTTLQGQYGHSGKLQKFDDVEEDVLHRLRELSGMIRS
jgi:hypothetical protein